MLHLASLPELIAGKYKEFNRTFPQSRRCVQRFCNLERVSVDMLTVLSVPSSVALNRKGVSSAATVSWTAPFSPLLSWCPFLGPQVVGRMCRRCGHEGERGGVQRYRGEAPVVSHGVRQVRGEEIVLYFVYAYSVPLSFSSPALFVSRCV